MQDRLENLAAAGIRLLPIEGSETHWLAERNGCAALLRRREDRFTQAGAPGMLTAQGFAVLLQRDEAMWLQAKGAERLATPEQVEQIRQFSRDLMSALFP